jgi:hypothetical protein
VPEACLISSVRVEMVRAEKWTTALRPLVGRASTAISSSGRISLALSMLSASFGRSCSTTRSMVTGVGQVSVIHAPSRSPLVAHSCAGLPGSPSTMPSTAPRADVPAAVSSLDAVTVASAATLDVG